MSWSGPGVLDDRNQDDRRLVESGGVNTLGEEASRGGTTRKLQTTQHSSISPQSDKALAQAQGPGTGKLYIYSYI